MNKRRIVIGEEISHYMHDGEAVRFRRWFIELYDEYGTRMCTSRHTFEEALRLAACLDWNNLPDKF